MIFAYILAGLIGGIVSGMGMGGGTLLIPVLTVFLSLNQHIAQAVNLLVFIPTAIVAVIIHAKNKFINYKVSACVMIPAIITAVISALIVGRIESRVLKIIFAVFLIIVGAFELVKAINSVIKKNKPMLKSTQVFKPNKNCINISFSVKK